MPYNTQKPQAVLSVVKGNTRNAIKASTCWVWRPKHKVLEHVSRNYVHQRPLKALTILNSQVKIQVSNGWVPKKKLISYLMCSIPQQVLNDKGVIDSGCSRHMTRNISYLTDYKEIDGGFVTFGGNSKGGKLLGKDSPNARFKPSGEEEKNDAEDLGNEDSEVPSTGEDNVVDENIVYGCDDDPNMPKLEEIDTHQEKEYTMMRFFSPVARIEAIRLFLAYASFKDFVVYQMDVKSAFLYGKIEEDVYVCQPPRFEDPDFPDRVYKVEKALYGLHQAPRAWYETFSTYLLDNRFQRGKIDKTLFIRRYKGDIMTASEAEEDKYVTEILKKFGLSDVKTASTPMKTQKALLKDADGEDVDEYLYRSMIGSLMYLTSSRPDIMFALGLRYPKDSPFDLVAYTDSAYARASLDKKSTTGGCQFLGCRLILWQCKKQTVVTNSITEVEYRYFQLLWTVKNPVFHSKTKHIEIKHHFIKDYNEEKLIQMIKIHTKQNVVDLLTKAFDVSRFQYLIATAKDGIGVKTGNSRVNATGHYLVFANMRRKGKDFSGKITPLFEIMLIQQQADMGEGSGQPTDPQHTSTFSQPSNEEPITVPSSSQPKKTFKRRKPKKVTKIP
ncbi:putative ribonuclease H-like domain-containing protein [Tanacetum coccineum]